MWPRSACTWHPDAFRATFPIPIQERWSSDSRALRRPAALGSRSQAIPSIRSLKEMATVATQTPTRPQQKQTLEDKVQQLRQAYADAPPYAKTALENSLADLASHASKPRARVESAGRTGIRQGKVSELLFIAPFAPGGAARLRALLQLRDGSFDDTDRVGTVHDMRFVFLDNDTKLLFATAYDGEWDPYIDDFATKI